MSSIRDRRSYSHSRCYLATEKALSSPHNAYSIETAIAGRLVVSSPPPRHPSDRRLHAPQRQTAPEPIPRNPRANGTTSPAKQKIAAKERNTAAVPRGWSPRHATCSRPSAAPDQRTASTYIFGAVCPERGEGAGLALPWCNTKAMGLHLVAISAKVASGRHAALLTDQAGWHLSSQLLAPSNITIVPLPAKCPELNPQENVWQFMRDN